MELRVLAQTLHYKSMQVLNIIKINRTGLTLLDKVTKL